MAERTFAVGLDTRVELLTLETPTTGLALTREGTLALCMGGRAVAVQLTAEELEWVGRAALAMAAEREAVSPVTSPHVGHAAGHA